jgi:hypothetical protein
VLELWQTDSADSRACRQSCVQKSMRKYPAPRWPHRRLPRHCAFNCNLKLRSQGRASPQHEDFLRRHHGRMVKDMALTQTHRNFNSISDIPKVYIVIFKSYFRRSDLDLLDAPALLLLLLDLHISSITVTLYENEEFAAPLEVMRADHIYRVHIACFIHCMMRSVSASKYPLCNDGTQYVWKDDYNIKIITVQWDPIERVQGIMALPC